MKKNVKSLKLITVLSLIMILIAGTMNVFAYEYELSLSAGNGQFNGGTVRMTTPGSNTITIANSSASFTLGGATYNIAKMPDNKAPDESKYFVRGAKYAGYDNDEKVYTGGPYRFNDEDTELVVAYGLKSAMVEYTVHYLDADENEIAEPDTFLGVAGDQVIISYKYVEGYLPQAWTGTAELSDNPDENNFKFWYTPFEAGEGETIIINDGVVVINAGGGAAGGGAGAAGGAAGGGAGGANIADAGVPAAQQPANTVNLNDNNTPLAGDTNGDGVIDSNDAIEDNKTPGADWSKIGIGAGAAAVIAIAAAVIAKRRKEDEEE